MYTVYTKKGCIYCTKAMNLLETLNLPFQTMDITEDVETKNKLLEQTSVYNHRTFPFIFQGKKFIGGFTEFQNLVDTGLINNGNTDDCEF